MSPPEHWTLPRISPDDLDQIVARAGREQWQDLGLIGPDFHSFYANYLVNRGWNAEHLFHLTEKIGAEGACALARLTNLTSLDLVANRIGDEGARALARLTNLTSLDLAGNGLGDEGARALAGLTNLTSLDLGGNRIGAEGARALARLTNLTSLDLAGNGLGDEGARALAGLTNLTSLDLGGNRIGAEGARALARLTNLTSLNLFGNGIGDEGARALTALSSLTSLDLRDNGLGDEGARALARLTNLTSLDLFGNRIGAEGARALARLTNLTSLNLFGNGIGDGGARALASLTNLTSLNLFGNGIGDEGARALASLTNLTSLALANNRIGNEGARALASLTNLTSLDLFGNGIGDEGARALARLTNLTSLALANNRIGNEGACALASLTNLTSLDLGANDIGAEGARALARLTNLTSLALANNRIGNEGARALARLTNLTSLGLGGNYIGAAGAQALLDAWVDAPTADRLRRLDLRGNGDLGALLPAEVLGTQDAQAILAAYRRYRTAAGADTLRPLNEAKLLVLGNEAVGKTSLIRYLVRNQPRDPGEPKTPGIAQEKIETQAWAPDEANVTLNVWDFGGQEIMHGTHRFFLTERSLYLLVLEARREDDRAVYDWLRTIRNRGGDSPIIVVINKCDDDSDDLRLDETGLRDDHPGIVAFARTSCDPGERAGAMVARLRELIVATLADDARLKHVRDPIPQSWSRVKGEVADLARERRVLPVREFERLCEAGEGDDAIPDDDEQRALLRLLHDLGVVVAHGLRRDARAALRDVTLLDPNWLTGAIYTLLNHPVVRDQDGEFERGQLEELLDPDLYPARWHEFILEMMEEPEIGLAFELPGSRHERYLIPEALPRSQPDYGVWPDDSLRFRYGYDLLPPGLIPRFIVQTHRNLTEHPTRWRTGVVLGAAECRILVRGDRDRRRIDIAVAGPEGLRRSALNVVLDDLDEVHRLNPEIRPKALVPLTDQPELDVSYEHLLRLEQRHGLDHAFDPEDAERPYTVRELLEGVRRERSHPADDERRPYEAAPRVTPPPADPAVERPEPAVPAAAGSWRSALAPWPFISIACGVGAVLIAMVLLWLPDDWRLYVGLLFALGLLVTLIMLSRNPRLYYRRWLSFVLPAGLLVNALGPTIELYVGTTSFRWDGAVGGWFFLAWAVVVGVLVWADLQQNRTSLAG